MFKFGVFGEKVQLPPGKRAVDSKLVFRIKRGHDGKVERFKSRLVARGFTQTKGEDYDETFRSVALWPTIRLLLALLVVFEWEVEVCDVDNAFLDSDLHEEAYLKQPAGMNDGSGRVIHLKKALYGLKQAPRTWEQDLGRYLVKKGLERCIFHTALYIRQNKSGCALILVYVDDLLLLISSRALMKQIKGELKELYKIKDLGPIFAYLGLQVTRDSA